MSRLVAIIPARMGSSRFPGKPLAPLHGLPMIEHVRRRVQLCSELDEVLVATCDREIAEAVEQYGGHVVMTSPTHERASDRVAEAAASLDADIVVMVQGDEPMVVPEMITLALEPLLRDPAVVCSNLAAPIEHESDLLDRNTIKVVMDRNGDALYFSRGVIPTQAAGSLEPPFAYKQVCVIPFRGDFLLTYAALQPTPLEAAESVDMLRILEHGYRVRMVRSPYKTQAVDLPSELARVEELMRHDPLLTRCLSRS